MKISESLLDILQNHVRPTPGGEAIEYDSIIWKWNKKPVDFDFELLLTIAGEHIEIDDDCPVSPVIDWRAVVKEYEKITESK